MSIITSAGVKAISLGALEQMSLDLMQCEGRQRPFREITSLHSHFSVRLEDQHRQFGQRNVDALLSRSPSSKQTEDRAPPTCVLL